MGFRIVCCLIALPAAFLPRFRSISSLSARLMAFAISRLNVADWTGRVPGSGDQCCSPGILGLYTGPPHSGTALMESCNGIARAGHGNQDPTVKGRCLNRLRVPAEFFSLPPVGALRLMRALGATCTVHWLNFRSTNAVRIFRGRY
jgi:hypothetical protein